MSAVDARGTGRAPARLGEPTPVPGDDAPRRQGLSLRGRVVAYLVAIHGLLAVVAVLALAERPLWLFAAEAVFALSIVLGVRLVRAFFVPLALIRTGAELIAEQDFSSTFRPVGQPEMDELIEVHNRMLARLREERLRVQEQDALLSRLLEASPAGIVTLDFDGRVLLANPAAVALFGADPRGCALADVSALGAEVAAIHAEASAVLALPGGRRLKAAAAAFVDRGFPRRFYVLEELTAELHASERAAYGKLIRMMSHEINNSAGAVSSLLESLRSFGAGLDETDRAVFRDAVAVAIERLARLRAFTGGFADVVRLPDPDPRPCDLAAILRDLLTLWRPQLEARGIACTVHVEDGLPPILADRNQIEQVLVNVLKNAQEAIGERGTIAIAARREGGRTTLCVRDSGPGLRDVDPAALFTPFFTTKPDGRGLGLTIVREILSRHGFGFALTDARGGGAEFEIRF